MSSTSNAREGSPRPISLIEPLESRRLMAAITLGAAGVLRVDGTDAVADSIVLGLNASGQITARINGGTVTAFAKSQVKRVDVRGRDGNDAIGVTANLGVLVVVHGGTGRDTIVVAGGRARVFAGGGDDVVVTGAGNDTVHGGAGNDSINAGNGRNVVRAGSGNDTVRTGSGNDTIFGSAGNDTMNAGGGMNAVWDLLGRDTVDASLGTDRIHANTTTVINGADPLDIITRRGETPAADETGENS